MEFDDDAMADVGNVSDVRGGGFPGGGLIAGGGGAVGLIGLVLALLLGGNPLSGGGGFGIDDAGFGATGSPTGSSELAGQRCKASSGPSGDINVFAVCAFNDAQKAWRQIFEEAGRQYAPATLVLYSGQTQTQGCGAGSSAAGPFYCPADQRVYLDTTFFDELKRSLGAPGDFAQAYVIAHEVGHHVQNVLGTNSQVANAVRKKPSRENELSVRTELQADCYSGIWANVSQRAETIRLDPTDPEEAIRAAGQIGDDRLQRSAGRRVNPESFTHGSAEQRVRWLRTGLASGDPSDCNTFKGDV